METLTKNQEKIINLLTENGIKNPQLEHVALHKVSNVDYYSLMYNFNATGVHVPEKEVDESSMEIDGIKIWHTKYYKF